MAVIAAGNSTFGWNILIDPSNPNAKYLGVLNQTVGIIGVFSSIAIGLYQIRLSKRAGGSAPASEGQPRQDGSGETALPSAPVPRRKPGIIDHGEDLADLRQRLTGSRSGIVIVTGPPGIGKAELVEEVLWELEHTPPGPSGQPGVRVLRCEAGPDMAPGAGLDVGMLAAAVGNLSDDDVALQEAISSDSPPLDELRAALEKSAGDTRVIIAVRHAEHLLDPVTRQLRDPELDEAFEVLTRNDQVTVIVILMTRHSPEPLGRSTWSKLQEPISVKGLDRRDFIEYLHRLPADDTEVFKAVAKLHSQLRGNPRLAQLAYAAFQSARQESNELLAELKDSKSGDRVLGTLMQHVIGGLKHLQHQVLEALDAYDTAVRVDAVCALVVEEHHDPYPAAPVRNALEKLVKMHLVVKTAHDEYRLGLSQTERKWAGLPDKNKPVNDKWHNLLRRAAYELHDRRVTPPRTLADLRLHLAELRALLWAGDLWDRAYNRIHDDLDPELRTRNHTSLLLEAREKLRGKLGNEMREMANHNALGELYASKSDFPKAHQEFSKALEYANDLRNLPLRTVIRANWAMVYWRNFEVETAYGYYELARDDHDELSQSNPEVYRDLLPLRMNILEGLADCHRHWGEYSDALQFAEKARALPESTEYPHTPETQGLTVHRRASIGMKLASWHAELGEDRITEQMDETVRAEVNGLGHDWLRSGYLSGHAYLLAGRNAKEAIEAAGQAVELASKFADPVILLQARTTLCLAYLREHDLDRAARQVEAAMQYHRSGDSLLPLALQGLVAAAAPSSDTGGPRAGELFQRLQTQAEERLDQDSHDVAAWDFKGFAGCGLFLDGQGVLKDAIAAFHTARHTTRDAARVREPTPGLVEQWLFLLERLNACGPRPGLLQPVIDVLEATQLHTSGS
ncbi:ATP-binding protein [Nonomuraea sp. FMUSA5-5]|uniref:ATP-binding protein n=1 Tax=Nonomuraea composti TaxID=2720023 RepID=A0ABX1BFX3_9ACTN|nr:ATP-binding protein [Nonomuraea sp. FMUSA5-5]NJP96645.1 ATP-binding protein [Nonomuraea sp. FMUSA5-5]